MGIYMTVGSGDWTTSAKLDLDETVGLEQACQHDEAVRAAYLTIFSVAPSAKVAITIG